MKRCSRCDVEKPLSDFYPCAGRKDGRGGYCKVCAREASLARYHSNKEHCQSKHAEWCSKNYAKLLLNNAKTRARKKKIPYTLTDDDVARLNEIVIDGNCELSGLPFTIGNGQTWDSPSIDRIDSSMGYEPGNVRVVLHGLNAAMGNWGLDITIEFIEAAKKQRDQR